MKTSVDTGGQADTQMLNAFQHAGRAMLEELLPVLHHPKECPDAMVDGWGDLHAGRSGASTVRLLSVKCALPDDKTRVLARLRLERGDDHAWTVTVSLVAAPEARTVWPPPGLESDWWSAQRELIRARLKEYRHPPKERRPEDAA
jgi:hypothetical protein